MQNLDELTAARHWLRYFKHALGWNMPTNCQLADDFDALISGTKKPSELLAAHLASRRMCGLDGAVDPAKYDPYNRRIYPPTPEEEAYERAYEARNDNLRVETDDEEVPTP